MLPVEHPEELAVIRPTDFQVTGRHRGYYGYVTNPIFRFVARFLMGYTSEMEKYLTGLAQHFGEKPQIGE